MSTSNTVMQRRWEQLACLLMIAALALTLFGTLVFVNPVTSDGPMSGSGSGLHFGVWIFGMAGLFLCFLENAVAKKPLMLLGYGWSAASLTYAMAVYKCPFNEWCMNDTSSYGLYLAATLIAAGVLLFYDKKKDGLAEGWRLAVRVVTLPLLAAWLAVTMYVAATSYRPFAVRTPVPLPAETGHTTAP